MSEKHINNNNSNNNKNNNNSSSHTEDRFKFRVYLTQGCNRINENDVETHERSGNDTPTPSEV